MEASLLATWTHSELSTHLISRHFKLSDFLLTHTGGNMFFLQNLFSCSLFPNSFLLFSHTLKKVVCFSRVESLWVQGPLFVPIITHFKFRICVGSKIPISHPHKQMMTKAAAKSRRRENKTKNMNESTRESQPPERVFLPSLMVHGAAIPGEGRLLGRRRLNLQPV